MGYHALLVYPRNGWLLTALLIFGLSSISQAQNPWELANGPSCFEQWIQTTTSLLNGYEGSQDFNARKPWSLNQYGILEGGTAAGPHSAYEPDAWSRYGNKYAFMWLELYRADAPYPAWNTVEWQSAGIPGLRYFVLNCLSTTATIPPNSGSPSPTSSLSPVAALDVNALCPNTFSHPGSTLMMICYCSPDALTGSVWGTDIYTSDSALCAAAVHAGVISLSGGMVTVKGVEGQEKYEGSTQNGVSSASYGSYSWSFTFPTLPTHSAATPPSATPPTAQLPETCPASFQSYRDASQILTCSCTAAATETGSIWGTDIYTDDSSICKAALHAGYIGSSGGTVKVQALPGQASYLSSTRNGVTSSSYSSWGGSFQFTEGSTVVFEEIFVQLGPPVTVSFDTGMAGWSVNYGELRNTNGYLETDAPGEGLTSYYLAPRGFHGDWRGYQRLSFDLFSSGGTYYSDIDNGGYGDVYLVNGTMTAKRSISNPHDGVWRSYSLPLYDDGLWILGGGANRLEDILGNITDFQIRAEYGSGTDTSGLDNVRLE